MMLREHANGRYTSHCWPRPSEYWCEHAQAWLERKPVYVTASEARYILARHCWEPITQDDKSWSPDTVRAWNIGPPCEDMPS